MRTRMTENGNDYNDNGGCNGGDDTDMDDACMHMDANPPASK